MNQYTILRKNGKISLKEFREALSAFPRLSEAGEYSYYDELTGERKHSTGRGLVCLIAGLGKLAELRLDVEYGLIHTENADLVICEELCKVLKAGVRPVLYHGPNAPLPDLIFDYNV